MYRHRKLSSPAGVIVSAKRHEVIILPKKETPHGPEIQLIPVETARPIEGIFEQIKELILSGQLSLAIDFLLSVK